MAAQMSWKKAMELLDLKEVLDWTIETDTSAQMQKLVKETLPQKLIGFWAVREISPNKYRIILEDQEDIMVIKKMFFKERLLKQDIPVGKKNAKTSSGNIATVVFAL